MASEQDVYNTVHRKTWVRRFSGFLAGGTVGAACGAIVGAVAAFLPALCTAIGLAGATVGAPTLAAIGASIALFSVIGTGMGIVAGADVGAAAGAGAAVLTTQDGAVSQKIEDSKHKTPKLYSWKAAPILMGLFAAFGALAALSPLTAPAAAMIGVQGATAATATAAAQSASAAAIATSAGISGMMGALMPTSFGYITNKVSNFYERLLTGGQYDKTPVVTSASPTCAVELTTQEELIPTRKFAREEDRSRMQAILTGTDKDNANSMIIR